jgi:hypothetical protein
MQPLRSKSHLEIEPFKWILKFTGARKKNLLMGV